MITREHVDTYGPAAVGIIGVILLVLAFAVFGNVTCEDKCLHTYCSERPQLCTIFNCTGKCFNVDTLECEGTYPVCVHSDSFFIFIMCGILFVVACIYAYCKQPNC